MKLINCGCCGKKISDESKYCIYCGQPINDEEYRLSFAYKYNGEILNSPLFSDKIEKINILKQTGKVELYNKTYKVKDIICDAHKDIIYVILADI